MQIYSKFMLWLNMSSNKQVEKKIKKGKVKINYVKEEYNIYNSIYNAIYPS